MEFHGPFFIIFPFYVLLVLLSLFLPFPVQLSLAVITWFIPDHW